MIIGKAVIPGKQKSATPVVSTISFYISLNIGGSDTTEYQADPGMTWAQWIASAYNTDDYYVSNNKILTPQKSSIYYVALYGTYAQPIRPADEIIEDALYYLDGTPE